MPELTSESIDLVVTSPPYGSVVDYNRDNKDNVGNYRDEDYLKMIEPIYRECKRVLRPGRRLVVNIANVPSRGVYGVNFVLYGHMTVDLIRKIGFDLSEVVIWNKGRCRQSMGAGGTLPYPASPVLMGNWEYIFIFRKFGDANYDHVLKNDREESKLTSEEIGKMLMCDWAFPAEMSERDHPAPYPEELPRRIIKLYTFKGDVVMDPFGGSGTTGKVALELGRSAVLFEIEEKFVPIIKNRVNFGMQALTGEKIWYSHTVRGKEGYAEQYDAKPDLSPQLQLKFRDKDKHGNMMLERFADKEEPTEDQTKQEGAAADKKEGD